MAKYNKTQMSFFKFPNTFFDTDEIEEIEADPDGDSIIVLYLKLIALATNKMGYLCKIIAGELIPYTTEELAHKTSNDIDDFKRRLLKLKNVGLIELKDNMLFIEEALNYTNQSVSANKKEKQRRGKNSPPSCPPDKDIELDEELELEDRDKNIDIREKKKEKDCSFEQQEEKTPHPALQDICSQVVEYLNKKAFKHYQPDSKKTVSLIKQRLNEGYIKEDFYKVIDNKTTEWKGTDYEDYLRPITLFSDNFESYLYETPCRNEMDWKSYHYENDDIY